jgi:hypothetical protein
MPFIPQEASLLRGFLRFNGTLMMYHKALKHKSILGVSITRICLIGILLSISNAVFAASLQVLEDCNEPVSLPIIYTVLDKGRNTLDGWNHVDTAKPNGEYSLLKLGNSEYRISKDHYQSDESCDGIKVQNAVLVMKLSDWTRQHSNGFEAIVENRDIKFGDITHVLMDIRINSEKTEILDYDALKNRYKEYLGEDQFEQFDQGKVNLGITLFEEGALDQSSESLSADIFLEIDHDIYADRWLRVIMPISEFSAYAEKNYDTSKRDIQSFASTRVNGFRITPENSKGKQLRNLLGSAWTKEIGETFKEMSISLRRIELLSMGSK